MKIWLLLIVLVLFSCSSSDMDSEETIMDEEEIPTPILSYFPPTDTQEWETVSKESLGWNEDALAPLEELLISSGTKAFIILKNGRIVMEEYYNDATATENFPWFSAGKTLTAFTAGIAQQENYLAIGDPVSLHLNEGWTQMTPTQEGAITIKDLLTMTSGGDYNVANWNCTDPDCLNYLNDPGGFWFYHNAFYTLLQPVIDAAVPNGFNSYFNAKVQTAIGMNGAWISLGYSNIYYSNARSMARFGLLVSNEGNWDGNNILDSDYFNNMTNTSQLSNKSYGYLWWLNGKESHRLPAGVLEFDGMLIHSAPNDLIAGLGKSDQKLYVVPSKELVVIRLGEDSGNEVLGPSGYDTLLWERINDLID